jgi:hypothetical protein
MTVVEQATAWLGRVGLPEVPLPRVFHSSLQQRAQGYFTTLADGPEPYNFDDCVASARADCSDHLLVGLRGHGVNSWAVSYHLLMGQVRLLLQVVWAGAFQTEESKCRTLSLLGVVAACGPELERRALTGPGLFLAWSDFYSVEFVDPSGRRLDMLSPKLLVAALRAHPAL